METIWFSPQVEKSEPSVQSCFLPDPPPTTPPSPGKPWHKSLKQNSPSSQFPLLCQRWPSAAEPNMWQCKVQNLKGDGGGGWGRGGEHSTRAAAGLSRAGQAPEQFNTQAWKVLPLPLQWNWSRYRCDCNGQRRGSWRAAIAHSAKGNWVSKGKLLSIRCRISWLNYTA